MYNSAVHILYPLFHPPRHPFLLPRFLPSPSSSSSSFTPSQFRSLQESPSLFPSIPISSLLHIYLLFLSFFNPIQSNFRGGMKVHPAPRKRNINLRYDVASAESRVHGCRQKKLRRLPHIFEKFLELPFPWDADVSILQTPVSFIFSATTDAIGADVRADAIQIHPGVTKIVVRDSGYVDFSGTELELDLWRFRLPETAQPELASAAYDGGQLIVTVPTEEEGGGGGVGGGSRLVLVQ